MKLKYLFMSMLGAALFVGCNNEIDGPGGNGTGDELEGESTTATFMVNFNQPATYAGGASQPGTANENAISDIVMFVYKLDGAPEAMAYIAASDNPTAGATSNRVTVKCKSGDKLIYVAGNIGKNLLLATGLGTSDGTNSNSGNGFLGDDTWAAGSNRTFSQINAPIWAISGGIQIADTAAGFATGSADFLIRALNNNGTGTVGGGVLVGENAITTGSYFMSNWGDKDSYDDPQDINGINDYLATCKFKLAANITAAESQVNTSQNYLEINVQRGLAKVKVNPIAQGVLDGAGTQASNYGKFIPHGGASNKWALGNINKSEYPFQLWDGKAVMSTRYNETATYTNPGWVKKMDNTRFEGTQSYALQNLQVMATLDAINTNGTNQLFSNGSPVLATENNHESYANQYSSFIVFGGQYQPATYVKSVSQFGVAADSTAFPAQWLTNNPATVPQGGTTDTMYYLVNEKRFILGTRALAEYICYITLQLQLTNPVVDPYSDVAVTNYINDVLLLKKDKDQALLQRYYRGNCFYRVWIQDQAEKNTLANKYLVRRNHIYDISIENILGPGIGDPNDIIDPDPDNWEPIEEADTWVTAKITPMNWHIVEQKNDVTLE